MPDEIKRWAVKPLHRTRRGVEERLLLALPWLGRIVVSAAVRAPAGSRLRRAVVTRLVRIGLAGASRGDYGPLSAFVAPDIELFLFPDEPESRPGGFDAAYYGPEGYFKALEIWKEPFSEHRWDLREFVDRSGNRIGARTELVGRGAGSGVEVRLAVFYVWQLERGLLRRQWALASEEAMLAVLEPTHPLAGTPQET